MNLSSLKLLEMKKNDNTLTGKNIKRIQKDLEKATNAAFKKFAQPPKINPKFIILD